MARFHQFKETKWKKCFGCCDTKKKEAITKCFCTLCLYLCLCECMYVCMQQTDVETRSKISKGLNSTHTHTHKKYIKMNDDDTAWYGMPYNRRTTHTFLSVDGVYCSWWHILWYDKVKKARGKKIVNVRESGELWSK